MMQEQEKTTIKDLGLDALKQYACPKIKHKTEWYMDCLNCTGIHGCSAGQRVWVILNEQTEPEKPKKKMHRSVEKSLEELKLALASGDIRQYLINKGNTRHTVSERIRSWKKNFPEYFPGEEISNRPATDYQARQKEKAMDDCKRAIASGEPIEYIMKRDGVNRDVAYSRVYVWKKKYPELFAGLEPKKKPEPKPEPKPVNIIRRTHEQAKEDYINAVNSGDPVDWLIEKRGVSRSVAINCIRRWEKAYGIIKKGDEQVENVIEEDEVSVADFLSEMNVEEDTEANAEPVEEVKEEYTPEPVDMLEQFKAKGKLLEEKKAKINKQIMKLGEELKWVEKQMDALATVMNMFNPGSAIGQSMETVK